MSGWDEGAIYYSDQAQSLGDGSGGLGDSSASASATHHSVLLKLKEFIRSFETVSNSFPYRESLQSNPKKLVVDLEHLHAFDSDLPAKLRSSPADYLPLVPILFCRSPSTSYRRFSVMRSRYLFHLLFIYLFVFGFWWYVCVVVV